MSRKSGTSWVRSLTHRGSANQIYLARITLVEVTSAVARRRKGGPLTPSRASSILYRFRQHFTGRYAGVDVTPALAPGLQAHTKLANEDALRAYDAVQLAAALEVSRIYQTGGLDPIILVSSDQSLNAAATAEGLTVEDPNSHP